MAIPPEFRYNSCEFSFVLLIAVAAYSVNVLPLLGDKIAVGILKRTI